MQLSELWLLLNTHTCLPLCTRLVERDRWNGKGLREKSCYDQLRLLICCFLARKKMALVCWWWLCVALCGSHHRTPLGGMVEPLQVPLVLVASVRGLSGLSQRPGEGFVGVLSKCCHLQENNGSVGGLSQDGKQGKWVFVCHDQKGRWMGGVGTVPLSHVARRLHCSTSTCCGSVLSKPGGT